MVVPSLAVFQTSAVVSLPALRTVVLPFWETTFAYLVLWNYKTIQYKIGTITYACNSKESPRSPKKEIALWIRLRDLLDGLKVGASFPSVPN